MTIIFSVSEQQIKRTDIKPCKLKTLLAQPFGEVVCFSSFECLCLSLQKNFKNINFFQKNLYNEPELFS